MKTLILTSILCVAVLTSIAQAPPSKTQYLPRVQSDYFQVTGSGPVTNPGYFVWHGDTIDFRILSDSTIVFESDSTILFVTLKQMMDSLQNLPGGHSPVTLNLNATNGGFSLVGQELNAQKATLSQPGYISQDDYNNFYYKLSYVNHDTTLIGDGTNTSQLKVNLASIATKAWVLAKNYVDKTYINYDSLLNKPTIPVIENIAYGPGWNGNLNGTTKNTLFGIISSLPGGHSAVTLSSSATQGGLSLSSQEISFQPATASQSGYLPSKDWTRFNKDTSATNELDNIQSVLDYGNKYYKTTTLSSDSTFAARYSITQTNGSSTNKFYNSKFYTTYSGSQNQATFGGIANSVNNAGTGTVTYLGGFPLTINTSSTSNTTNIYSYPVSIFQRGRFNKMSGHTSWIYNYGRNVANNDAYGSVSTLYNYGFFDGYAGFQVDAYNYASMNDMDGLQIGLYTSTDSLNTMTGITMGYLSHAWTGSPKHSKGIYINRSIDRGTLSQYSILSESRALSRFYGKFQLDTLRGTGNRFVSVDLNGLFSATKKDSSYYWNNAYAKKITALDFTGTDTITLKLTLQDGTILKDSFPNNSNLIDYNTTTGITYKNINFDDFTDSTLVTKLWVLQQLYKDNDTPQILVGLTPYWDVLNGKNAIINVSNNEATITMANLLPGKSGVLTVNCGSIGTSIVFSGYTIKIHDAIRHLANTIAVGANTENVFSWYYDGISVKINGGKNFH